MKKYPYCQFVWLDIQRREKAKQDILKRQKQQEEFKKGVKKTTVQ